MKALCYRTVLALGISGIMLCLAVAGSFAAGTTTPASPKITATRTVGNTLLVAASVPKGWQAVVLESRALPNSGAWVPRAVARSGLTSGRISFAVPAFLKSQTLRVRGELKEALPQAFYKGVHSFAGQSTVSWRPDQGRGEVFTLSASGSLPAMAAAPAAATSTRTVVESDIWKLDGDTLYYFNQLRGLQVIDVSNPDAAVVRGTLPLPAVGEQMYLLDSQHVVLLAQNSCGGDWQSQVLVVDVSGSAPRTVAAVPVEGWLQESRLVGTALYIASQDYRQTGSGDSADWQYGTVVSAFDLSSPAAPVARPTLWYPGYESAILATDHWLFVTTVDYSSDAQQNLVRVVDISSPDGTLQDIAGIPTAGQVPDKYSMNLSGDVFSAVSQSYQYGTGVGGTILNPVGLSAQPAKDYWDGGWITTLETFSLANPSSPAPLGSLQVANGELLDATRFDGTRAYIATSQEWDPLWVVDLSDPANPVTAGSVDVPGWSTYILPMGDELLTLGTVTDRVAVSLFDVHAAANPILQSQVLLGQNYSWSDAAYDDKALTVLSGLGLILVPYEGDTTNGWSDDVQLIDLGQGTLTARGMIQHRFAPLRSLAHNGRIISVSNEELLSVDISDRDNPQVDADVEIAWPVNQLYLQGGFLVEIANGGGWFGADPPAVRVALAQSPDAVAARLDLDDVPVVGSTLQNGLLYLLQSPATAYWGPIPLTASTLSGFSMITDTNLLLTVVDVSALPALSIVGQTVASPPTSNLGGGNYQPVWPSPGLLVWFNTGFGFWINPLVDSGATGVLPLAGTTVALPTLALGHAAPISLTPTLPAGAPTVLASAGSGAALGPLSLQLGLPRSKALAAQPAMPALQAFLRLPYWRPWWSSGGATLLAFDVSNPAGPGLVSTFDFSPTNGWGFSAPLAAQGLVYFSYEQPQTTWPVTVWRASDSLEVVDYTDPANPTLRPGVNVPGQLAGLSPDGSMLYLLGNAISTFGGFFPTSPQGLNACAYDGVSAYLVASLQLPQSWPQPLIISSNMVYLGRADATGGSNNTLEAWALSSQGQFKRQALAKVAQPLSALAAFGSLLAAQDENNNVSLFDASLPTALIGCGQGGAPGCLWFDLNRAAGALGEGLWLSLDDYGVAAVPYVAPAANARK